MDHELKQRLIGAVVVTALAAIFIPMLFDDPVDNSGKTVTELTIPQEPADSASETAKNIPENKAQVLERPDTELSVSEVEEVGHANAAGEGQATKLPDGEQTEQPGMAESLASEASPDIQEDTPADDLTLKQPSQNEEPSLDTGVVDAAKQPEASQDNAVKPIETVKKSVAADKPKAKAVPPVEKTAEKAKATTKTQKEPIKKSSPKLVRYSIQAGSFSKKENAQALVEKLRKQGMPAAIVTKGDLYRVKIGPELDKKKATAMKAKLDSLSIKSLLHSE